MKKYFLILFVPLVIFGSYYFVNLKKPSQLTQISTNLFLPLLNENAKAMNEENIDLYMRALHPNSPSYAGAKQQASDLFAKYDINVTLDSVKVISATENEIIVEVVQTSKRVGGGEDYKDTKVTAAHTLTKYEGTWKIYSTVIKDINYLN